MLLNCRGRDGWWHHRLDGHEFEWSPGAGDGQGGLACCDSWGRKESDTTERLNCTEMNACKTELGKGRGIGRESLRLQCSSDLCENEGGSIWEKEARDYYSEIVSAGPTGNSCVMTPMQELALGKMPRPMVNSWCTSPLSWTGKLRWFLKSLQPESVSKLHSCDTFSLEEK